MDDPPQSVAQKRPATDEVAQPADKRARAAVRQPGRQQPQAPPADDLMTAPHHHQAGGILNQMAQFIHGPVPIHSDAYITVSTNNMTVFFAAVRHVLIEMVYPGQPVPAGIITEADWNIVMRSIVKARVDHVYTTITGLRPQNRIPLPRGLELPKCISDLANGIGSIFILKGGLRVIPEPEVAPQGQDSLAVQFTQARIRAASILINAAKVRGIISVGTLSNIETGTAWWLMSARNPANTAQIAADTQSAVVHAIFAEWTPADAMLCALVQNRFDGLFGDVGAIYWTAGYINGITALRTSYITDA